MGMLIRIAVRNLIQAKWRTLFLGMALSLVTGLLVLLLALSAGLTDTMVKVSTTMSSGHVNVAGFFKAKPSDATPLVTKAAEVKAFVKENLGGVEFVVDRTRGWGRIISETSSLQAGLNGIDVKEERRFGELIQLANESEYKEGGRDEIVGDINKLAEENQALLFVAQAKRLGVEVGDVVTVTVETTKGARNTGEFVVAAVAKDVGFMSNWNVFAGKSTIRALYQLAPDTTGAIQIYLFDHKKATEAMGELQVALTKAGYTLMDHSPRPFWEKFEVVAGEDWTGQKLDLTIWKDEVAYLVWVLTAVDSTAFFLIAILMVIIAVGIMNSMWMAVRERTSEIGTLRAIGMSRTRVLVMFLLEGVLLGLIATSVGAIGGSALAAGLDAAHIKVPAEAVQMILMSDTLHLVTAPMQIVGAVIVFTLLAGAAALWPALRASRMQPVTAIQHVG